MNVAIYNSITRLIRKVDENTEEQFTYEYIALSEKKKIEIRKEVTELFPQLSYESLDEYLEALEAFVDIASTTNDMYLLLYVLGKLDRILADDVDGYYDLYGTMQGLNDNQCDVEMQLIPNRKCSWKNKNKDKNCSVSINNLMEHMMYIDLKKCSGYKIVHKFLEDKVMEQCLENGYCIIGAAPLNDSYVLRYKLTQGGDEINRIQIGQVDNLENVNQEVEDVFRRASSEKVDILCFPEMLGTYKTVEILQRCVEDYGFEEHVPLLTICPTYIKEGRNIATVLDVNGEIIYEQEKHFPYSCIDGEDVYNEELTQLGEIFVTHCIGLGRIGIAICKDALNRKYLHQMLEELKITLLLVPSYSTGHFDFEQSLKTAESYNCAVLWINACSARPKEKKSDIVGFVLKTGKATEIANGKVDFETEQCAKNYGGECRDCLYTQKLYCGRVGL